MSSGLQRVFLSQASANLEEVTRFDCAMRRCGVPLWRDRTDLGKGAVASAEIQLAAKEALGFTFYLTREAAVSEWVRETELGYALENAKRDGSFGIVPIFRHGRKEVCDLMEANGKEKGCGRYDLSPFNGYIVNEEAFVNKTEHSEFSNAAETVLLSVVRTKAKQAAKGATLRIGVMTRDGPLLRSTAIDLLVDWTVEYPPQGDRFPNSATAKRDLLHSLAVLGKAISQVWVPHHGTRLQIVPQCHLSMALAFGYQFRRNTGVSLDVIEPQSGEHWAGPRIPLNENRPLLGVKSQTGVGTGTGLGVALGISRSTGKDAANSIKALNLDVGELIVVEPASGPSLSAIPKGEPEAAHILAVTIATILHEIQAKNGCRPLHLFLAAPAAFAVLLGQQLSNVGPVQTYEWNQQGGGGYLGTIGLEV